MIFFLFLLELQGSDGSVHFECQRHFGVSKINTMQEFFEKYPELNSNSMNTDEYFPKHILEKYSVNEINYMSLVYLLESKSISFSNIKDLNEWTYLAIKLLLTVGKQESYMLVQIVGFFVNYAEESLNLDKSDPFIKIKFQMFLDLINALSTQLISFETIVLIDKFFNPRDRIFKYNKYLSEYWSLVSLKFYLDYKFLNKWLSTLTNPTQKDYDELRHLAYNINDVFLNHSAANIFKYRISQIEYKLIGFYKKDILRNAPNTGNILGLLEIANSYGQKSITTRRVIMDILNSLEEKGVKIPSFSENNVFYNLEDFKKMKLLKKTLLSATK
ncbi:MAG: hypothetical protein H6622_09285 [Halobacteriovoraceae bacterium]|nr:hypothetical protein [Halobacteriovoraceae bacterium]